MYLFIGENCLIEIVKIFGILLFLKKVLFLVFGILFVKVIDMVNVYGIFVNGGKEICLIFIKWIEIYDGEVVY